MKYSPSLNVAPNSYLQGTKRQRLKGPNMAQREGKSSSESGSGFAMGHRPGSAKLDPSMPSTNGQVTNTKIAN